MIRTILWATAFAIIAAIIQSTILQSLAVYHVVPDLALGILVFTAYVNGTMIGQGTGFVSGFALDFLSASPIGFNALIRTIIGALTGLLKGAFFLDSFILPMALCLIATLVKALIVGALFLLFAGNVPAYSFFSRELWIETAMNTFAAPALFAFLKLFRNVLMSGKEQ